MRCSGLLVDTVCLLAGRILKVNDNDSRPRRVCRNKSVDRSILSKCSSLIQPVVSLDKKLMSGAQVFNDKRNKLL